MSAEIEEKKKDILYWMVNYIENDDIEDDEEPPYAKADVQECGVILDKFIVTVLTSEEKSDFIWIKNKVKDLVLALNKFNDKHDHSIIETGQREGICELIDMVINKSGHELNEDITEEWREW